MASNIIPLHDGRYWRVRVRRPAQGIKISERFKSEKDAQRYIDTTVTPMLSKGEIPLSSNSTRVNFEQFADLYLAVPMLDMTGERELKATSQAERRGRVDVLKRIFGRIKLTNLTPAIIEKKLTAKGWSRINRQKYEVVLNRMLEWGRTDAAGKIVAANPMRSVRRAKGSSKKLKRVYSKEEWNALLSEADEESVPLGLFLRLARVTGCRKGELRSLLWDDVNPSDREGLGASLYIRDPKSGEPRTVFIRPDIYLLLKAHEQEQRTPDQPRVFPHKFDFPFRRSRERAGIDSPDDNGEYLTIHAVRRTFATALGKRGATLAQMRAAGGWKTAEQAMRYMQIDDDLAAEAALLAGE